AAGLMAPDFTLTDINGKPFALSSLRGKYVVLDFWGSWCSWCIKGIPEMKNYYEKYKGKFEILGVDCNDTDQKWKDAVKKYELPWLHVYNPRDSKVLEDYGIQGFPTKIIVGPDGKIVKTIVGEDPAFYSFLDETFGKYSVVSFALLCATNNRNPPTSPYHMALVGGLLFAHFIEMEFVNRHLNHPMSSSLHWVQAVNLREWRGIKRGLGNLSQIKHSLIA
ncbi:MAG: TlpA family protein disulfide reductase, partial [Bacteroidota bacterium]|nr:TlpA family protein disulfide reductase [Bacteroidota bacterium]